MDALVKLYAVIAVPFVLLALVGYYLRSRPQKPCCHHRRRRRHH